MRYDQGDLHSAAMMYCGAGSKIEKEFDSNHEVLQFLKELQYEVLFFLNDGVREYCCTTSGLVLDTSGYCQYMSFHDIKRIYRENYQYFQYTVQPYPLDKLKKPA